jgi:phosphopantothenoylcysteine decarboxylase/phosphopantothenate--cysteine ligase
MEKITLLQGRRVVLGVTGSISVYKAIDLASKLTQAGALVDVVMSEAAQEFVTPLAFQAVTGRSVYTDMWRASGGGLPTHIAHVGLGEGADVLAIIPATANALAKLAHGLADDLLSVTALAARCPLVVAPAMDGGMYDHPATQANLATLLERGATLIPPEEGRFASGLQGKGRLPETPTLLGYLRLVMAKRGALAGRRIVVTAGGTREAIDPVRYVGNRSSGKQGFAIAQAALDAGASVTLITSVGLPAPIGAVVVTVESAKQMLDAVLAHSKDADALVMAAAVADFAPQTIATHKIKKKDDGDGLHLDLVRTPDILLEVRKQREATKYPRVVVGFAAESDDILANAQSKLERKGLDLMVANDITAADAGFAVDTNRVTLLDAKGAHTALGLMSKAGVAEAIVKRLVGFFGGSA